MHKRAFGIHHSDDKWDTAAGVLVAVAACLSFAVLILKLPVLPLADVPNHIVTLAKLGDTLPSGSLNYLQVFWTPRPNMAMEMTYVLLGTGLAPEIFAKLFLLTGFCLYMAGIIGLSLMVHGRITPLLPVIAATFFSMPLHLGFMNYVFTAALLPGTVALYLYIRRQALIGALLFGNAAGALLLAGHGFGLGIFGLVLAGLELGLGLERRAGTSRPLLETILRAVIITALASLVPMVLMGYYFFDNPSASLGFRWPALRDKLFEIAFFSLPYARILPFVVLLFLGAVLTGTILRRRFPLTPLLAGSVLLVLLAAIAMPSLIGGFAYAHTRLWSVVVALGALALIPPVTTQWRAVIWCTAAGLFVWQFAIIAQTWSQSARDIANIRAELQSLEEGASVVLVDPGRRQGLFSKTPMLHVGAYAALDRNAFVPSLFALPEQHLIRYRDDVAALSKLLSKRQFFTDREGWLDTAATHTDSVILLGPDTPEGREVSAALTAVGFTRTQDGPGVRILSRAKAR